ncbi:MAG: hypothetical protein HY722_11800 [Planctomycetes bacterium]|nr:hypothetical protein [Planctomycetota bacterium]
MRCVPLVVGYERRPPKAAERVAACPGTRESGWGARGPMLAKRAWVGDLAA